MSLLTVDGLRVAFDTPDGPVTAVDGVSFTLEEGRTLSIVGESGAGKTALGLTLMGLIGARGAQASGRVVLDGRDLLALAPRELRRVRGDDVAMVFQDPLSSLHPFYRVGRQIAEAVRVHRRTPRSAARAQAVELLAMVGIPDPRRLARAYPHELSGGMRQRAMIAMALANEPRLLIADEPTTALDVTVQAQILELIAGLQAELTMAVILITHDLGVVAQVADEIAVMYAGRVVEHAPAESLFDSPQHPYTWALLKSIPRLDATREQELMSIPGRPPSLLAVPSGCAFHPRCRYAREAHRRIVPALEPVSGDPDHRVACLLSEEERARGWHELAGEPDVVGALLEEEPSP